MDALNPQAAQARAAQGLAVALLVSVLLAGILAFLVARLHAGPYAALLFPAICGWALGGAIALVRQGFPSIRRRDALLVLGLAALIFCGALQLFVYDRVVEVVTRAAGEPAQDVFQTMTGRRGLWAYLTFTSQGHGADLSPLGVLGHLEPGVAVTVVLLLLDPLAAFGAGAWALVNRERAERAAREAAALDEARATGAPFGEGAAPHAAPVREILARTDAAHLLDAMKALEAGALDAAAAHLRAPIAGPPTHAVAARYVPFSDGPWDLELLELHQDGGESVRGHHRLSSWDGQALADDLRVGRQDPE